MHDGNWNHGWDGGSWIPMAIMMVLFLGGVIWLGVTLMHRGNHGSLPHTHGIAGPGAPGPSAPTAHEILAGRLAHGEIEPEEYRQRLDALGHGQGPPAGKK